RLPRLRSRRDGHRHGHRGPAPDARRRGRASRGALRWRHARAQGRRVREGRRARRRGRRRLMAKLSEAQRAFIREPHYAVVTTLRADGSPHSTVVWVDEEDGKVLFNTTLHRSKFRDLDNDPRASVVVVATDGYHWVAVSGTVTLTTEGAHDDA